MTLRLFLLSLGFSLLSQANPVRFEIKDLTQRNLLAIVSDAPLEKTMAQCHLLRGWVELNPQSLEAGIQGELEVDVRSCETGSGVRDMVIQEKVLDTKQFPLASISLKKWAKETKGALNEKLDQTHLVESSVQYHDKTVSLELPLKFAYFKEGDSTRTRLPGDLLRVSSQMEMAVTSFGINVPDDFKNTLNSKMTFIFDAVGSRKLPNEKILLPEGAKPKERT